MNIKHRQNYSLSKGFTQSVVWFCAVLELLFAIQVAAASAGISTDGTVGPVQTLSGTSINIPQSLGSTVGTNLFHSFSQFNISSDQTVTFSGDNALHNVISRVTGPDPSAIDGTLRSAIPNADFYFINPNGVTFGANAQVDVPAAFHVSTANQLKFADNAVYNAAHPGASSLSAASPASFGFLGSTSANNSLIRMDGTQLSIQEGQTLDVTAANITLENGASLNAPTGDIRLVAIRGVGDVSVKPGNFGTLTLPVLSPNANNAGNISIQNSAIYSSGDGGGHIALWGNSQIMQDSTVYSDNLTDENATTDKGIEIQANTLQLNNSTLTFDAFEGMGNAGDVRINAKNLQILNGGMISSDSYATGDAGTVQITADILKIDGQNSTKLTGISSDANASSSGAAGSVSVKARDVQILNKGSISSSTYSTGDAGVIQVSADTLLIDRQGNADFTGITSIARTGSTGQAGEIIVDARDLQLLNGGGITSDTYATGNAGITLITADSLKIDGKNSAHFTGISSDANTDSTGGAGDIEVNVRELQILNGGWISSDTYASGAAGTVQITADSLTIDNRNYTGSGFSGITSDANTNSTGKAGGVSVNARYLQLVNGGGITSDAYSSGDAGTVQISADILNIDGQNSNRFTGITSETWFGSSGKAGDVIINAKDLQVSSGGEIGSKTLSIGDAGNVLVNANNLRLNNATISSDTQDLGSAGTVRVNAETIAVLGNGSISSAAVGEQSSGKTGDITINAKTWLQLADGGSINIKNEAVVSAAAAIHPGVITITAADIDMQNSSISTAATGNVAAGKIIVNFAHWLTMDPSYITTTANTGNGGAIAISGGELLHLENSAIQTSVSGADSNGGDINVTVDTLLMDSGLIQANAIGGSGGNVSLNLSTLIPSGNMLQLGGSTPIHWTPGVFGLNVIQAASQAGVSGTVNVTAPQLNLSGVLANLGGPQFDTSAISQDYCERGTGSSLTRKGAGGLKRKSSDLLVF